MTYTINDGSTKLKFSHGTTKPVNVQGAVEFATARKGVPISLREAAMMRVLRPTTAYANHKVLTRTYVLHFNQHGQDWMAVGDADDERNPILSRTAEVQWAAYHRAVTEAPMQEFKRQIGDADARGAIMPMPRCLDSKLDLVDGMEGSEFENAMKLLLGDMAPMYGARLIHREQLACTGTKAHVFWGYLPLSPGHARIQVVELGPWDKRGKAFDISLASTHGYARARLS